MSEYHLSLSDERANSVLLPPSRVLPSKYVPPRTLMPLEVAPVDIADYPALPHSRSGEFISGYEISTHIFPAAYPRCPSTPFSLPYPDPAKSSSKRTDWQELVKTLAEKKEAQEQGRDTRPPNRNVLWTVANRIVKTSPRRGERGQGLTLIFLHGIGTHKETWEPTLTTFLKFLDSSTGANEVDEIWMLDGVQHGDASLLNEKFMGDTFDCEECSRDLLNFILSFLPDSRDRNLPYPTRIPRLCESEIEQRRVHGFRCRTLVGVGHSIGACSYIYPAIMHPKLFSALILIESFAIPEYIKHLDTHRKNEELCLRRRWIWKSREAAVSDIKKSTYYRCWDPKVLDYYIQYAITPTEDGRYRLKTHPYLEALMLFERAIVYEAWELLSQIDADLPLHWIWGGKCKRAGGREVQAQTTYRHPGRNSNSWYPGVDHLLPQEIPDLLAKDIFQYLSNLYLPGYVLQSKL